MTGVAFGNDVSRWTNCSKLSTVDRNILKTESTILKVNSRLIVYNMIIQFTNCPISQYVNDIFVKEIKGCYIY